MSQRQQRAARKAQGARTPGGLPPAASAQFANLPPARALALPFAFTLVLAAFATAGSVQQQPRLLWAIWGAAGALLVWTALLHAGARRSRRTFALDVVLRKQHYVQACAQLSVYLYWGWYWREVYDSAHLIAAQLAFAYAFDMRCSPGRGASGTRSGSARSQSSSASTCSCGSSRTGSRCSS